MTIVRDEPMEVLEVPDSVTFSPDGSIAAVGRMRDVVLVSSASGRELRRTTLPAGDSMLTGAWADGDTLVVGGWKGTLNVLDASDLSPVVPPRLVAPGWITDLVISEDGGSRPVPTRTDSCGSTTRRPGDRWARQWSNGRGGAGCRSPQGAGPCAASSTPVARSR